MQALRRREQCEPQDRLDLFRDIADHCRARVTLPEQASLGLTDEQYLKNIVDTLFRSEKHSGNISSVS